MPEVLSVAHQNLHLSVISGVLGLSVRNIVSTSKRNRSSGSPIQSCLLCGVLGAAHLFVNLHSVFQVVLFEASRLLCDFGSALLKSWI